MPVDRRDLPSDTIDEDWEATWIVGCGPGRCRRGEICDLPVQEWGKPHWGGDAVYAAPNYKNSYRVSDVDAEERAF